jgi:subtilisin family serine protease
MTTGYYTASHDFVRLEKLPFTLREIDGNTVGELGGREWAAMSTARVMRAAQTFFDLPSPSVGGASRVGRAKIETSELGPLLARKPIAVYEDSDSGLLRVQYREIVLRFKPDTPLKRRVEILEASGLKLRSRHPLLPDQIIAYDAERRQTGDDLVRAAARLAETDGVAFATPNFVSQYRRDARRGGSRPPRSQWHLAIVGAANAWKTTRGKASITIAILDDGVDVAHPDLRANIRRRPDRGERRDLYGRDFFLRDTDTGHFDPRPKRFRAPFDRMRGNDIHGTCCAGIAAARGPHVYGIAPSCRILPVKIFHADDLAADAQVADAIRYAALHADVLSCSWDGPRSPDLEFAIRDAHALGRNGRGAIVVGASGNERDARVGYPASDPNAIAVGASTDRELLAAYSNRGVQLCVVAPSDGGDHAIFTTDVSAGGRGFNTGTQVAGGNDGLCTNDFGGTSSATPLVAGLCALLLSIDAKLSLAQIRGVLKATSRKIGPASAYDPNGHSTSYGWGRIDAAAAVAMVAEAAKARLKRPAAKSRTRRVTAAREARELRVAAQRAAPRR